MANNAYLAFAEYPVSMLSYLASSSSDVQAIYMTLKTKTYDLHIEWKNY